jgi:signal transduction histidine kinase
VDLAPLARAVLERLQEFDPGRSVQWTVPARLAVEGDRTLLRQLLENLLGNAWKFTAQRSPGRIEIGCEAADPGWVRVFVRDNGAGFDTAHAHGLFEPFRRMHARDEFPGTGIGLAFVRRIVELHGGTIGCEAAPGAGARFHFTLPAAPTLQG